MFYSPAFTFASVYPLGVWRSLGLRLRGLRQFQAFLASNPCAASASSYFFASAVLLWWRSAFSQLVPAAKFKLLVLVFGSNKACYRATCAGHCVVRLLPWIFYKS